MKTFYPSCRRSRLRLVAQTAFALLAVPAGRAIAQESTAPADAENIDTSGRGWVMRNLDLDITILPEERRFFYEGVLTVRLDGHAKSDGPVLLMNSRHAEGHAGINFDEIRAPGATVEIRDGAAAGRVHQAKVTFAEPKEQGAEVEIEIRCTTDAPVGQLAVGPEAAVAGWTAMWLPWTIASTEGSVSWNAGDSAVAGMTTLRLPSNWIGVVDGELVNREQHPHGIIETWRTPAGIARSFAAGPYAVTTWETPRRPIRVYLLPSERAVGAEQMARQLGEAIVAQEAKFGPFPFQGAYSVVEFPRIAGQSFGAASQQTFILAQPPAFDFEDGNLQLLAHEAAHAWWANTVGTSGSGAKWVGETLAELGAAIAFEALQGRDAMLSLLNFGRPSMDPYYNAAGYFALMRQGQDLPIATMGNGGITHALANSKGLWIYHMLRVLLGDERFFGVLRGLIRDFAHREMSADDVRARFIEAASEHDLETFFAQWLDRAGAPVFDVDWHATVDGGSMLLKLTQLQSGEPFELDLDVAIDVAIDGSDESSILETVHVRDAEHVFEIDVPSRPIRVHIDPEYKLFLWRPEYGPRPGAEIISESEIVPEHVRDAVVGLYRFRGMEKHIRVFARDGAIYVQPEGWGAVRILYQGDGVFHLDAPGEPMITEFDLSVSPSPTLKSIEGQAGVYIADRVAEDSK